MSATPTSKPHENIILGALVAVIVALGTTRAAAWCAFRLAGRRMPHGRVLASLAAFAHFRTPSAAWGVPVGSVAVYWALQAVPLVAVVALALLAWKVTRPRRIHVPHHHLEGLASKAHVAQAAGVKQLARHAHLRPGLDKPAPKDLGFQMGRSQGIDAWSNVRDSRIVLGPPGSGKGLHLAIPAILDAPGAVVTTSTRTDNLAVTLAARSTEGRPVAVFDPQRLAPGVPNGTRWSPIRGCEQMDVAVARAAALVPTTRGVENADFWVLQAREVTRCLLHAAALAARQPADLYRWSLSPEEALEAVAVLKVAGADLALTALSAVIGSDQRKRDGVWGCLQNAFAALADPRVLDAVSPGPGEMFDPETFLEESGTLYLLGTSAGHSATANLLAAMLEDIIDVATRRAAVSPSSRLDPPLTLVLDEAANYPLRSLDHLMSQGGGTGISTWVVLQSLSQARHEWGHHRAQAIWDSATVKLILGGGGNADDLADLSRLLGEVEVTETSESARGGGERSVTTSTQTRPIFSVDRLRTLPEGHAVLLLRTAPPIVLDLAPWTARRDAERLQAAKGAMEETMRLAASQRAAAVAAVWGPPAATEGDQ